MTFFFLTSQEKRGCPLIRACSLIRSNTIDNLVGIQGRCWLTLTSYIYTQPVDLASKCDVILPGLECKESITCCWKDGTAGRKITASLVLVQYTGDVLPMKTCLC